MSTGADWVCALARLVGAWDSRQADMFERMHLERDNLWAALEFCMRQPDQATEGADLAQDLWVYWSSRGPWSDVRRVVTSLAAIAPEESLTRARLLCVAAIMAAGQNDHDACMALSEESLRIGTQLKDAEVVAWSSSRRSSSQRAGRGGVQSR